MELKQWNDGVNPSGISLLIVPYGIETVLRIEGDNLNGDLLIVPYGIETAETERPPGREPDF